MGDMLVVQSKIRELAKKSKLRLSGDAVASLSKRVEGLLKDAGDRARANKRQTIKASDI
jgi:histone H3/H4